MKAFSFAALVACALSLASCADKHAGACSKTDVNDALLDEIYSEARVQAAEYIGDNIKNTVLDGEMQKLKQKPLLSIDSVEEKSLGDGAFECTAMVHYHTGKNVRDIRSEVFDPPIKLRGFDDNPPDGLFHGIAVPERISYKITFEPDINVKANLNDGWRHAVTAAGMLSVNRYFDVVLAYLATPGEASSVTPD